MRNNSKYSVLMSLYKKERPEFFKCSVESMINQSLPPNEILIVRDGPLTEELEDIITYYVSIFPEMFTIISLEKNSGLGIALNKGLRKCRNELVARMDTDDISLTNRCKILVDEFINDENLDIVGSNIDEFYDSPDEIISSRVVPTEHEDIIKFSRRRNPFNHPSVMYKKSSILSNGGYSKLRRGQDYELFVRILNNKCQSKNINESLVLFRANIDNLKRRKSFNHCKSHIYMIFNFWRKGYSSIIDLTIVVISQIIVFISPLCFFEMISNKYLRNK